MNNLTARNVFGAWPFTEELPTLQRTMDRLFKDERNFSPACEVVENDKQYMFTFDIPGMTKEDIKIEFNDNQLCVSGERKTEKREDKGERHYSERYYGSFQRTFALPANVAADKIEAAYEKGVLKVSVPKNGNSKNRRISIREAL